MKKFSSEIELSGHLIDSLILTKVFDGIMDHGILKFYLKGKSKR